MNVIRSLRAKPARAVLAGAVAVGVLGGLVLPKIAANADPATLFSINDVTQAEGNGPGSSTFTFTVSVNAPPTTSTNVDYTIVAGTAKAPSDLTLGSGTLVFAPLTLSKTIPVTVTGDTFPESNENFTVVLSNPTSGGIADATGVGTITNDDGASVPALSVSGPAPVSEGTGSGTTNATFTVNVANPVAQDITVDYATASGSATQGTDFTDTNGTLTIAANATTGTINVPVTRDSLDEDDESFTLALSNPNNATLSNSSASATITDDDLSPVVTIGDTSITEGNNGDRNVANFVVSLDAPSTRNVTVSYTTQASATTPNATANEDFLPASGTATIPAGQTSIVVPVTILGDIVTEPNEFFDVAISSPVNATLGAKATGTATIQDDEGQPTITINSPSVVEGNAGTTNAIVTFTLSAISGSTVTVGYTTATGGIDGDATSGVDFEAQSGTVSFPAGTTTVQKNIVINGDLVDELEETFRVVGSNPQGAALAGSGFGTVTINDDDTAPQIVITDRTADEGTGSGVTPFVFTISLNNPSGRTVTVNAATGNPQQPNPPAAQIPVASSGTDYGALSQLVTFNPGESSKDITVNVNKDSTDEADEVFNVILTAATGATIADSRGVGTIRDDDAGPAVTITANTPSVPEGNNTLQPQDVTFTVSLAQASTKTVTVAYATADGSAQGSAGAASTPDYQTASGTLTFSAGDTSEQVTVQVNGDTFAEPDESFLVNLSNPVNATLGSPASATQLITNDDNGAIPSVSVSNAPDTAEGGNAVFTFTATGTVQQTVTVNYTTIDGPASGSANPAVQPGDYTTNTGSVTFTVASPGPKTVSVATINDTADEDDEFFHLDITSVQNGTQSNTTGQAKITDNDAPPTITVADKSIAEGTNANPTASTATVTLSAASSKTVTVDYSTGGGTATATDDYASTTGTLTFAPGETTKTIPLSVVADSLDEVDETFNITLATPTNSTIADGTGVVTITDDDAAPTVSLGAGFAVAEGNPSATNTLDFPVNLSAVSGKTVTVTVTPSAGTATAGTDFTATPITVTFAPGETAKTANVPVTADAIDENDETVTATLSAPTNATLGTPTTQTGTITDDDAPPTVTISNATATEGTPLSFTVTLSGPSAKVITVTATTATGSATAGTDFTAQATTVTFAAGDVSESVSVGTANDTLDEADETFTVTLSAPNNATLGSPAVGTGTITDNDAAPTITIADKAITEGTDANPTASTATVTLSTASGQTVTVDYSTGGGTATATSDYTSTSGTLTFAAGETTKTIPLSIVADASDEDDETFNITLATPTNSTIADGTGVVTITDDDAPPTVSFGTAPSAAEGNASATNTLDFPVNLSAASVRTVTVTVTPSAGTATAGTDFTATPITVTFNPGETTKTANVPITGDTVDEDDETVTATLSAPTNATLGTPTTRTGTITDDDGGPTISISNATATEGTPLSFTVSLSSPSSKTVTVTATTGSGTATAGTDFTAQATTVTFVPGDVSESVSVATANDTLDEADETFTVTLSAPTNATLGSPAVGTGTITDNDATPTLTINSASAKEGDSVDFTITLSTASGQDTTVKVTTTDGTAKSAEDDYTAAAGTVVTIPAGTTTKVFSVATLADDLDEADENFTATLSEPTNASLGTAKTGTGTILDANVGPKITTGAGNGGGAHVKDFNPDGTAAKVSFFAGTEEGGTRVARGDLDNDGVDEIITGSGPGSSSVLRVYDAAGNQLFAAILPYGAFQGGVFVGAGDIDGDGDDEIITGAGPGGGPHVRTFRYVPATETAAASLQASNGFFAFENFSGGVTVGVADLDNDGDAEILTGMSSQGSLVRSHSYSGTGAATRGLEFAPYPGFTGGVFVAGGDLDGVGNDEIVTSTGPGGGGAPHIREFNSAGQSLGAGIFAYDAGFRGGISLAVGDLNGDGKAEIVTGAGPTGGPHVKTWTAGTNGVPEPLNGNGFFAYDPAFRGGIWVSVGQS